MIGLLADAMPLLGGALAVAPLASQPDTDPGPSADTSVASIDTIAGFEALADEWQALESVSGSQTTPFQTYRFNREWLRHFVGSDTTFRVITVRTDGRLVMIMPLAVRRTAIGNVVGWMGSPLLQYGDIICMPGADPADWLDAAVSILKKDPKLSVLTFNHVRADAMIAPWLSATMSLASPTEQAIGVDLSGFAEPGDFARARTSRAARNRKRRRRLAQKGEVTFRVLESGNEAMAMVAPAIEMKKVWLETRGLVGRAFADNRVQTCLEALVHETGSGSAVAVCLEVGGEPASIEVAFRHNGYHCAFLGAFDPELSRQSPGQVQMQDTIEWCIGKGTRVYDLMTPADNYKRELGTLSVDVYHYRSLMSVSGIPAVFWSTYGKRGAKAAFKSLPRGIRNIIRSRFA